MREVKRRRRTTALKADDVRPENVSLVLSVTLGTGGAGSQGTNEQEIGRA